LPKLGRDGEAITLRAKLSTHLSRTRLHKTRLNAEISPIRRAHAPPLAPEPNDASGLQSTGSGRLSECIKHSSLPSKGTATQRDWPFRATAHPRCRYACTAGSPCAGTFSARPRPAHVDEVSPATPGGDLCGERAAGAREKKAEKGGVQQKQCVGDKRAVASGVGFSLPTGSSLVWPVRVRGHFGSSCPDLLAAALFWTVFEPRDHV
jgi:hypothetical protein